MFLRVHTTAPLVALMLLAASTAHAKVTFASLLKEMTDLETLTYFPDPAYTTKQFSSYDRNSTDSRALTDNNWFANGDRGQYLRAESRNGAKEYVLMDADGPGAIVRFWSANPVDAGIVRIYLDGEEKPVIEMPLADMLGGGGMPFVKPISIELSKGWNSYLPIPYAKHCKVTSSKPDFYYHINYRTYERGTKVDSYTNQSALSLQDEVTNIVELFTAPPQFRAGSKAQQKSFAFDLPPGAWKALDIDTDKPSAIHWFTAKVNAKNIDSALRGCVLEIEFDQSGSPSVTVPIGDFFGTAPGINKYASLPSGVLQDGTLYSRWVMPVKKAASIKIFNKSDGPVSFSGEVVLEPYKWTKNSMYFHAGFRSEYPIKTRPRQDWNFLTATGKGRFVGDMLHVTNPVKDWWGEGDEKIYVDGEAFPSHFGTGSEDYFGYAWCWPEPFTHAYHNQPRCDGPGNYGQTCVSRFHIMDNIPFTRSFKFDMEVWHWAECEVAMAATSYWYAFDGGTNTFAPLTADHLKIVQPTPLPPPRKVEGALEGEELKIIEKTAGIAERQDFSDKMSGGSHLWWRNANVGDTLTVAIPVEKAGRYEVFAVFTKAVDYGIHTLAINGKEAVKGLDLFNNGVIETPEQSLGTFDLKKGENTLGISITGANPQAVKSHMFGLDYVRLVPVK